MNKLLAEDLNNRTIQLGDTQPGGVAFKTPAEVVINNAIVGLVTVGAVAILFMFLWGAVEWILSGGDKERVANARKRITSSLIGMFLLAMTFVILFIFGKFIHFNIFGPLDLPSLGPSSQAQ